MSFKTDKISLGKEITNYTLDTSGNINIDGSIFQYGVEFSGGTGGTGYWTQSGTDIYYNDGSVAINKTSPEYTIDVNGDIRTSGFISKWKSKRVDSTANKYYKIGTISLPNNYNYFFGKFNSAINRIGIANYSIEYTIKARNTSGSIDTVNIVQINENGSGPGYEIDIIALVNGTNIDIYVGGVILLYQYPTHSLMYYEEFGEAIFTKVADDEGSTTIPSGTQYQINKTIFTAKNGNVYFYNNNLIGTTTDLGYKFTVQNNIDGSLAQFRSDGTGGNAAGLRIIAHQDVLTLDAYTALDNLAFATTGSEKMRITNGGDIGINKTPNKGAKLEVDGSIHSTDTVTTTAVIITNSTGTPKYKIVYNEDTDSLDTIKL